ncbi:MAG: hypothetical protein LUF25_04275 [Phascolarctobacterium sp.]|nr:hypothetical protein [Phascolarctobacterium sp.]
MLWQWGTAPSQRDEKPIGKRGKRWAMIEQQPTGQRTYLESPSEYVYGVCEDRTIVEPRISGKRLLMDEDVMPIELTTFCMGVTEEWDGLREAEMHFLRGTLSVRDEEKAKYLKVYDEIRKSLSICTDGKL